MDPRLALLLTGFAAAFASAQSPPRLLADLDQRPADRPILSSGPADFARVGAWTYFVANDPQLGGELFRTNGTAAGTGLFADLVPGRVGSMPRRLTAAGSRLFFFVDDGHAASRPWVSDGSPGGTRRIPGLGSVARYYPNSASATLGSRWVLQSEDGTVPTVWVTDGTAEGTVAVIEPADLEEGERVWVGSNAVIGSGSSTPVIVFTGSIDYFGRSFLWRSDGTRAGTWRTPLPIPGYAGLVTTVNDRALIRATFSSSPNRESLLAWDGSGSFTLLRTQNGWWTAPTVAVFDGRAWIADANLDAFALVTDGTPSGTRVIPRSRYGSPLRVTTSLGVMGNALWLLAGQQLFRVDPGVPDPVPVAALPFDPVGAQFGPLIGARRLIVLPDHRLRLFDTSSWTVTDLGLQISGAGPVAFGEGFGRAYFAHDDRVVGNEPWFTDGTPGGTRLLADLAQSPVRNQDSLPSRFWPLAGGMAFVAADGQNQDSALWLSDGSTAGTRRITSGVGTWGYAATALGQLFLQVHDPILGYGFLVTDGSPGGTRRLSAPGMDSGSTIAAVLGREVLFTGTKSDRPALFWTDGSTVRFVREFAVGSAPWNFVPLGECALFMTGSWLGPNELWSTDGTQSGTRSLLGLARIIAMTRWRDRVWIVTRSYAAGSAIELWFSDGTAAGTGGFVRLPVQAGEPRLFATRDRLFALSSYVVHAWDGTTVAPVHVIFGGLAAVPESARVLGDRLVFEVLASWPRGTPSVLWSSDGSAAGTVPISPPFVRASSSGPTTLTPIGARHALYMARDAAGWTSTWITDGTAAGTRLYSDRLLYESSDPRANRSLDAANGLAYVAMQDPIAGIEPHVIELDSSIEPLSRGCGAPGREAELFADLGPAPQGGLSVEVRSSAGSMALVFLSAPPLRPTPLPSAGRCILDVDPNGFVVLLQTGLTNGRFAQSWPLPAEPALRGVQATLQAAIAPTNAPLGFDLSNGLLVNLWR